MRTPTLILCALLAPALLAAAGPDIEFFPLPGAGDRELPFSDAVRAGDLLFLSGKIGVKPGTLELVEGGVQGETRRVMEDIRDTLARHGTGMNRVVKCTVFLADMDEWAAMNEVYVEFFPGPKPARSALGASGLALGARVEIECIAAVGG